MRTGLWSDIDADIAAARRHFGEAIKLFRSPGFGDGGETPDYLHEMAFLHAMQSGYTSFEAGLKRLFALLDEDLPKGGDSHKALLNRARRPIDGARPALIDERLHRAADELRGFRHVAMHTYDDLDPPRATLAVKAAEVFLQDIGPALAQFRAAIDP